MHVMMDLETWGTRPGSALRSIGAVAFVPAGPDFGPDKPISPGVGAGLFYSNIDDQSCLDAGLTHDAETEAWWKRQSSEAQQALLTNAQPLSRVVQQFHAWFVSQNATHVWCHGANFDAPLWTEAARAVNFDVPWRYWNVRCTRTLYSVAGFDPRSIPRAGTHHNALDDAVYQAQCVQAAIAKLNHKEP
jgi:hypothetical protein